MWTDDPIVAPLQLVWAAATMVVMAFAGHTPPDLLWPAAGVVLSTALGAFSQAIVIQGTLAHMRGRPRSLTASLQMALRVFCPVIGAEICVAVLSSIGFFLLVVPAFVLMTMWYVATPTCVVEQLGPWKSLRRSAALTNGDGWKIFAMMFVMAVLESIGTDLAHTISKSAGASIGIVATLTWSALFTAFSAALLATTYADLRAAKEGVDSDHIARVFD